MSIFIQDGRRGGHLRWATQAITAGSAAGIIISPFHTPRVAVPRHPAASRVATEVSDLGGEVLFDPSTHARLLPTSNDLVHYNTWQLWGQSGVGLDNDARRLEHIERVFSRQSELSSGALAPTLTLDSPHSRAAEDSFRTAQLARGMDRTCWQSLAGRRSFWRAGPELDAYVGQLASLRASCWVLTVVNDIVVDHVPDLADTEAFAGLLRTVHSLSYRSRVIVCHADYAGVPTVAAGATDLGSGWDRAMRYFDPRSFQLTTPGVRTPASYVTQGQLAAVLRRDTADAITRLGEPRASVLRGGAMPVDDTAERTHHLRQLHDLVALINSHGVNRDARVKELRAFYERAVNDFSDLLSNLPNKTLTAGMRQRWLDEPYAALKAYAEAEQLW